MSDSTLVRASRDGDQFHYLWAARRCLQLLSPTSGVVAITIEGASPSELPPGSQIDAGEELIDVAEYSGSEDVAQATLVRYVQLKHSTLHAADEWTPSRLEKTLRGFADRYRAFQTSLPADALSGKLELWFITNRPVSPSFLETVEDLVRDRPPRHPDNVAKLERFTSFSGPVLSAFCKLLRFVGNQAGYWDQRNILHQEVGGYLPESDVDGPTQLKELVTRKATSEGAGNPTITKIDVLRALKTDESRLFPAPCRIEQLSNAVPREHEAELISEIVNADGVPVVVHAAAGIGKSVFATRIKLGLPQGSYSVTYDCFGSGQYRSASGYRHRHRDALVQIANELAAEGLCHPLIPTPHADASAYVTAFLHRLTQAAASLRSAHPHALLCIVIDAADKIPDADNDRMQLDTDGFQLKGWVIDREHRGGLDDLDPWAGEIRFPPPSPAPYVVELMNLHSDTERRTWSGNHRQAVMFAQVWGHFREKDEEDEGRESGQRLQASPTFIVEFLRKTGMDLIIEVEIERRSRRSRYEGIEDDNVGFVPASARLFLLRADGSIASL